MPVRKRVNTGVGGGEVTCTWCCSACAEVRHLETEGNERILEGWGEGGLVRETCGVPVPDGEDGGSRLSCGIG